MHLVKQMIRFLYGLPNHKSLMPGDNVYKTFPNLYTIRGTTHRDVKGWIESLDHMKTFNPEFLFQVTLNQL